MKILRTVAEITAYTQALKRKERPLVSARPWERFMKAI